MTPKRKPREPKWITRARKALDEVEKMDPNDPSLAPFKTRSWARKGWPLGKAMGPLYRGPKTIACLALVVLVAGCLGRGDPAHLDRLRVLDELRQINYQLEQQRDTRHPVERYRPDIWNRMFAD